MQVPGLGRRRRGAGPAGLLRGGPAARRCRRSRGCWAGGGSATCSWTEDTAEFSARSTSPLTWTSPQVSSPPTFLDLPVRGRGGPAGAAHRPPPRGGAPTGVDGEGVQVGEGGVDFADLARRLSVHCPTRFIPKIWMGHVDGGHGFWTALDRLERWF
ncbi:hypothetical protein QJS66_07615 [Kocuria rhizophila]|nr:hypothetical protein QJS66_07615 [Kocuria rhizophila]